MLSVHKYVRLTKCPFHKGILSFSHADFAIVVQSLAECDKQD